MESFYLWLFIGACAALLLWGVLHPTRVYQYPFLIAAIFSAFMIPQAIALYDNPLDVSTGAIEQAFAMGVLCLMAAWLGYQLKPVPKVQRAHAPVYRIKRLRLCALVITVLSLLATLGMRSIPEAEIRSGTGPFTILAFFAGLASISFAYFLIAAVQRPTYGRIFLALVSGYPIYSAALFALRRSETSVVFMSVALAFFFAKRWVPSRVAALAAVIAVAFLIPLFADMREVAQRGEPGSLEWNEPLKRVLSGKILELRNAAAAIDSVSRTGAYGLGTGYWDAIVFRYVPGQLVGFDVKRELQFNWNASIFDDIGYRVHSGTTPTAIADTFVQFGYLGCLFFFAQGYLFKKIWLRAVRSESIIAQIAYISLMTPAMVGVTHGSMWFLQAGLVVGLVLWMMARFSLVSRARDERAAIVDAAPLR